VCYRNIFKGKKLEELKKRVHKFKGSLSHFEYEPIDSLLKTLESSANKGDISSLQLLFDVLKNEYGKLKEKLIIYREAARK